MLRSTEPLTAKQDTFTQRPATLLTLSSWAKGSVWFGTANTLPNPHLPCALTHFTFKRTRSCPKTSWSPLQNRPSGTYPAEGDAILLQDDGRDERHLVP